MKGSKCICPCTDWTPKVISTWRSVVPATIAGTSLESTGEVEALSIWKGTALRDSDPIVAPASSDSKNTSMFRLAIALLIQAAGISYLIKALIKGDPVFIMTSLVVVILGMLVATSN